LQSRADHLDNPIELVKELIVPKSQNCHAFLFEILVSLLVLTGSFRLAVLSTIQLNGQF